MPVAGSLLIEIGANVARLQHDINTATKQINNFARDTERIFKNLGVTIGGAFIVAGIKDFVNAAAQAEKSTLQIEAVLQAHGVTSRAVSRAYEELAANIAATTPYQKEQAKAAEMVLTTMGVAPSKMKDAMDATVQLATRTGDLSSAAQLMGQAFEGNYRGIGRIIPVLKNANKDLMDMADVMRIINQTFGDVAQRQMEGYLGTVAKLSHNVQEMKEALGGVFIPVVKEAVQWINEMYSSYLNYLGMVSIGTRRVEREMMDRMFKSGEWKMFTEEGGLTQKYQDYIFLTQKLREGMGSISDEGFTKAFAPQKMGALEKAIEEINKRIADNQIKAQYDVHQQQLLLLEDEWAKYQRIGVSRELFDKLLISNKAAREAEYQRDAARTYVNSVGESLQKVQKLFDQAKNEVSLFNAARIEEDMANYEKAFQTVLEIRNNKLQEMQALASQTSGAPFGGGDLIQSQAAMEALKNSIAIAADIYSQREQLLEAHYQNMQALADQDIISQEQAQEAHNAWILQSEQTLSQQRAAISRQQTQMQANEYAMYANIAMNTIAMVNAFVGSESKAMFVASKAVAIAMAIVQGHLAAISAAAAVAGIPGVGPIYAQEEYAKWMTLTYVNAGIMAATAIGQAVNMSGGASAGGGGASAAASSYTSSGVEAATTQPVEYQKSSQVNIYVYGNVVDHDAFAREIISSIDKAQRDGAH